MTERLNLDLFVKWIASFCKALVPAPGIYKRSCVASFMNGKLALSREGNAATIRSARMESLLKLSKCESEVLGPSEISTGSTAEA